MIIRQEQTKDYDDIYTVIKRAFESAEHSDGNEQDLVSALRSGDAYIPELSLVAEIDGKIAGHIMFTRVKVADSIQLALAPLSVLPEYQGQGVGLALIQAGHRQARKLGYRYSIVLGSEAYYSQSGYLPAKIYGIFPPFDVPDENFMAFKIADDAPDISGIVQYAEEFGIN